MKDEPLCKLDELTPGGLSEDIRQRQSLEPAAPSTLADNSLFKTR